MLRITTRFVFVAGLLVSVGAVPASAEARPRSPFQTTHNITTKDVCEREKILVCHWEGDDHICEWVDGPNCLVT